MNITGFNPIQAMNDINELHEKFQGYFTRYLFNGFGILFNELSAQWMSPLAVKFGEIYVTKYGNLCEEVQKYRQDMLQKTAAAVDLMAKANGYPAFAEEQCPKIPLGKYESKFKEDDGGNIGMDIEKTDNSIDVFKTTMNEMYEAMEQISFSSIALYDPDGAMQAEFKASLKRITEEARSLVEEIVSALVASVEVESRKIIAAKEAASAELGGVK